jgi:hypothetical protein
VAGSTVRGYIRKRKTELGLTSQQVDLAAERTEVFEWMRAVQQGAIPHSELKKELSHVLEIDKLLRGTRDGPLAQRKRAMTVLLDAEGCEKQNDFADYCYPFRHFLFLFAVSIGNDCECLKFFSKRTSAVSR